MVNVPPSPAACTGGIPAQAGAARDPQPTQPPRPSGFALNSPDRSTEDTMAAILQQLQRQQQQEAHREQQMQRHMLQMHQQMLQMQRALTQAPEAGLCSPPRAGAEPYPKEEDAGFGCPDPGLFEEPPGRVSPAGSTSSIASTASTSRWPSAVHKSLHRLQQVSAEIGQLGSKFITNLVKLRSA